MVMMMDRVVDSQILHNDTKVERIFLICKQKSENIAGATGYEPYRLPFRDRIHLPYLPEHHSRQSIITVPALQI